MTPVSLKHARPLVKRPYCLCVGAIQHPAPVPPHVHQPNFEQHPQMLRHRRLLQPHRLHNLSDRPFLQREIVQNLTPARFRHRIERIRCCRRPCHASTLHAYMGICQALFSSYFFLPPIPPFVVPSEARNLLSASLRRAADSPPRGPSRSPHGPTVPKNNRHDMLSIVRTLPQGLTPNFPAAGSSYSTASADSLRASNT